MKAKTSTLLVISIAAILSLSVVSVGEIPQALADKNEKKDHDDKERKDKDRDDKSFKKFSKKPDFESKECIITPYASGTGSYTDVPDGTGLTLDAFKALNCSFQAWFDKKEPSLVYKIVINGMEMIDTDANTQDDLYQLHVHKNTHPEGTPENPKGPHVLDVYRAPVFGDADLIVLPVQGELRGIWDSGDHDSFTAPDNLEHLCNSEIFAAGHGDDLDRPGHHAPYVKMLLEPTNNGEKICKKLGFK
ncbi:MAG: hypothetical protein OES15_02900 [Nitrosopumilus sp.]|nr:hypothetical protein [Nitrosopumilus sp.]